MNNIVGKDGSNWSVNNRLNTLWYTGKIESWWVVFNSLEQKYKKTTEFSFLVAYLVRMLVVFNKASWLNLNDLIFRLDLWFLDGGRWIAYIPDVVGELWQDQQ